MKRPIEQRFAVKVRRLGGDGCWVWTARCNAAGYDEFHAAGTTRLASHVALELAGRPRPTGMIAIHSCDNPPCVNPAHLKWASHLENMRDREAKGRTNPARGERKPCAKLTAEQVRRIRGAAGTHRTIATVFGVSHNVVGRIKRRTAWTHVDDGVSFDGVNYHQKEAA